MGFRRTAYSQCHTQVSFFNAPSIECRGLAVTLLEIVLWHLRSFRLCESFLTYVHKLLSYHLPYFLKIKHIENQLFQQFLSWQTSNHLDTCVIFINIQEYRNFRQNFFLWFLKALSCFQLKSIMYLRCIFLSLEALLFLL